MILIPIFILVFIFYVKLKKGAFAAFLVLVATKSIMDAFWVIRVGSLSFSSIGGIIIPFLFFPVLSSRKYFPRYWKRNAILLCASLSMGYLYALPVKFVGTLENILLTFNIYLGFFIIPVLINDATKFRKLLIAIMVCGIFPILVSLFQFQTGVIFYERETAGLTRYVGFYHDAFPVRFFGLMTLLAALMYLQLFKVENKIVKWSIYGLSIAALFSVYLVFSKAGVTIIGLWIAILFIFSKSRIKQSLSIIVGLGVLFLVFGDTFFSNLEQLFSKETGYQAGQIKDARYTLAGRGYIWQDYWDFWTNNQSVYFQWFGDGLNRPAHNEFLRILLISGIVGVFLFTIFLIRVFIKSIRNNRNTKVFALMLATMFVVDCIGLMPGNYYFYNIVVWGLIGLFLIPRDRIV